MAASRINRSCAGRGSSLGDGEVLARQAIDRALTIDPDLAVAYSWLAATEAGEIGADLVSSAAGMQRALSLEPSNSKVLVHAGSLLQILDRLDDSSVIFE